MDFNLSDEQAMFAETARNLFSDTCPPAEWHRMMDAGEAFSDDRWRQIVDNGLTALMLPEAVGGMELSELDVALIAIEAGYAAIPEPVADSAGVGAPMLATLAPDHPALIDPRAIVLVAHPLNPLVANADVASAIIFQRAGRTYVADREELVLTPVPSIDPLRRLFQIQFPDSAQELPSANWDLALDRGAILSAATALGIAQRSVDLAVAYAKDRQQFGKPIGSYQAVKHHLASSQVAIEFARPLVLAAAAEIGHGDVQSRARVSEAKIVALEAADLAARASIQVHGAMGYSWEVDVHLFLKRALALTNSWGTPQFHRARIAERIFTQPVGPDQTFSREVEHA